MRKIRSVLKIITFGCKNTIWAFLRHTALNLWMIRSKTRGFLFIHDHITSKIWNYTSAAVFLQTICLSYSDAFFRRGCRQQRTDALWRDKNLFPSCTDECLTYLCFDRIWSKKVAQMLGQIIIIKRGYWIRYTRSRYILKMIFDLWSDLLRKIMEEIKIIWRILIAAQIRSSTKKRI